MQIKELVLDGFKSYGVRTHISGFDKYFNAITGLNGSGKSNILDAICFVMGISTLSHVRASNLNELVYKNGKAGIKKATVTIKLTNIENNVLGIDDDVIEISRTIYEGKSKYYINGMTCTQDKVKSLFLSANLNINNPHFLIMQGKVTKVVNMSASDILSLIEEASGTGIYEIKKDSSIKTVKKKDNKLTEIDKYLSEVITPRLEELQKERQQYLKWKDIDNKIQRMRKTITAHKYFNLEQLIKNEKEEKLKNETSVKDLKLALSEIETNIHKLSEKIKHLDDKNNNELDIEVNSMEEKLKTLEKNKLIALDKKNVIKKQIDSASEEKLKLDTKRTKLLQEKDYMSKKQNTIKADIANLEDDLEKRRNIIENMEDKKGNINDYIENINNLILDNESNMKKIDIEISNINNQQEILKDRIVVLSKEIADLKSNVRNEKSSKDELIKERFSTKEQIISKIKEHGDLLALKQKKMNLEKQIQSFENYKNGIIFKIKDLQKGKFDMVYSIPENNFDSRKIKGRLVYLFSVKNKYRSFIKALDRIAGFRLFNIVVDNNDTSTILLDRRCFKTHETLLPLNKISAFEIDPRKKDLIYSNFGNDVILATDALEFNSEFEKAIKYVFGNTFIVTNDEIANKLAYDNQYRVKCFNLDGDSFDPSGVMSGGSSGNFPSTILKAEDILKLKQEVVDADSKIDISNSELNTIIDSINNLEFLNQKVIQLENQIESSDEKAKQNKIINLEKKKESIEEDMKYNKERIKELSQSKKIYIEELSKLKSEYESIKGGKDSEKTIQNKILDMKKENSYLEQKINHKTNETFKLDTTIKNLESEITLVGKNLEEEIHSISQKTQELKSQEEVINKINSELKEAEFKYNVKKKQANENFKELTLLTSEKEKKETEYNDKKQQLKISESKLLELERGKKENLNKIEAIKTENPWIEKESQLFNVHEDYDFSKININEIKKVYKEMKSENEILEKKVNLKVDMIVEDFEKQYNKLKEKKEILKQDKIKIEKTIKELDVKRKESLNIVYKFVNEKFNSIYSTFLPGASAKLETIEGKSLLDGLEMKVAFNNSWKNSLSELSGGQRSLLALSFILSLLCYKPAPFYILDEIDAALDLSHTSNLGAMIKEHFPQSQFIIVSLKDGMFNNANVLFQVSFAEGSSKVNRIVKELKNANYLINKKDKKEKKDEKNKYQVNELMN